MTGLWTANRNFRRSCIPKRRSCVVQQNRNKPSGSGRWMTAPEGSIGQKWCIMANLNGRVQRLERQLVGLPCMKERHAGSRRGESEWRTGAAKREGEAERSSRPVLFLFFTGRMGALTLRNRLRIEAWKMYLRCPSVGALQSFLGCSRCRAPGRSTPASARLDSASARTGCGLRRLQGWARQPSIMAMVACASIRRILEAGATQRRRLTRS